VRGPEAFDLLQAMNTGHDGSMGTLHANSPREALSRVESMITMGGYSLPSRTIREMIVRLDRRGRAGRAPARRLAPHHPHHRGAGHGRRRHHHPGHLRLRHDRRGRQGNIIGRHRSTGIGRPRFWDGRATTARSSGSPPRSMPPRCRQLQTSLSKADAA
jgi:pilus assembly protein CpaF